MDSSRLRIGDGRVGFELFNGVHGFCLFGPFLAKLRYRVCIIAHHLGEGIPLGFLSGRDGVNTSPARFPARRTSRAQRGLSAA